MIHWTNLLYIRVFMGNVIFSLLNHRKKQKLKRCGWKGREEKFDSAKCGWIRERRGWGEVRGEDWLVHRNHSSARVSRDFRRLCGTPAAGVSSYLVPLSHSLWFPPKNFTYGKIYIETMANEWNQAAESFVHAFLSFFKCSALVSKTIIQQHHGTYIYMDHRETTATTTLLPVHLLFTIHQNLNQKSPS